MSILTAILIGLATGIVFGFALEKSRVFEPGVIVGQFQLRNFIMLKVFLSAVITGLIVLALMHGVYGVSLHLKPLLLRADIIGGVLLGIGIALAGACPGTTLAQIGAGYRDAWIVLLGALVGATVYGYFNEDIVAAFAETGDKLTLAGLFGQPFWLAAVALATVLVMVLAVLETWQRWTVEVGENVDGLMPQEETEAAPQQELAQHH